MTILQLGNAGNNEIPVDTILTPQLGGPEFRPSTLVVTKKLGVAVCTWNLNTWWMEINGSLEQVISR